MPKDYSFKSKDNLKHAYSTINQVYEDNTRKKTNVLLMIINSDQTSLFGVVVDFFL